MSIFIKTIEIIFKIDLTVITKEQQENYITHFWMCYNSEDSILRTHSASLICSTGNTKFASFKTQVERAWKAGN